ncbi:MAG: hypothetical protein WBA23_18070 [Tunicatimonas sp.]|uniref:hypothetical protein n=1 Tax=Tunicatimonas sp. TaxID=1940096 RepID=UPI003C755E36
MKLTLFIIGIWSFVGMMPNTIRAQADDDKNLAEVKRGYYVEEDSFFLIEAENYAEIYSKTPTNGTQQLEHSWVFEQNKEGYSDQGYMSNLPDEQCEDCDEHNSPKDGSGAELVYHVYINTPGTYNVWVRGYSRGGESNGLHVQLDGKFLGSSAGTNISGFRPHFNWVWENKHKEYAVEPNIYMSAGKHTIHIFGRDDGFSLDQIFFGINQTTPPFNHSKYHVKYVV